MIRKSRFFALAALVGLLPASSHASDAVLLGNNASRCEIFRALSPDVPDECQLAGLGDPSGIGRSRSIRQQADGEPRSFSIAMRIQFKFDSAELTSESKTTLGQIAQVLRDDLMQDKIILLEGHADATGRETYNLDLSERRAGSVRRHLVLAYGVSDERLQVVGRGELDLFDAANPRAPVNRRVEFTNLSD